MQQVNALVAHLVTAMTVKLLGPSALIARRDTMLILGATANVKYYPNNLFLLYLCSLQY